VRESNASMSRQRDPEGGKVKVICFSFVVFDVLYAWYVIVEFFRDMLDAFNHRKFLFVFVFINK
jgi:hypothetical protein